MNYSDRESKIDCMSVDIYICVQKVKSSWAANPTFNKNGFNTDTS